jgi:hypothetical protein
MPVSRIIIGLRAMWAYNDIDSSPDPNNQLYRGSAAFSELETQIIRDFGLAREFRLGISYHSYSQAILFPWAYANLDTPHDALLSEIARNMSQERFLFHPQTRYCLSARKTWSRRC